MATELPSCDCIGALPQSAKLDAIYCVLSQILEAQSSITPEVNAFVSTTNGTPAEIFSVAIPSDTTVFISARVYARRTGGSAGTAQDGAAYEVKGTYKNVGGVATEIGQSSNYSTEDQQAWTSVFTVSGGNAILTVTGAANNNVNWGASYQVYSIQ